jgi:hypothetical protein
MEDSIMKLLMALMFSGALLLGGVAQAAPGSPGSPDALARVLVGPAPDVVPLAAAELADIRGEGTIEKFIALPRLHRSWETLVTRDNGLSVSIVGVAGEGITIRIESPHIP